MFVYVIVNSEALKIYIGQHKGQNLQKYLQQKISHAKHGESERSHLYRALLKYPQTTWSIHPLISDLQTREECDYWEKVLIKALKAQHPDVGYNITRGGEGFTGPHTEQYKAKMRRIMKGRKPAGLLLAQTPEARQKRSASLKAIGHHPPIGSFKGHTHSKAARKKIGLAGRGRIPWNKGKKNSQVAWNKGLKGCYTLSVATKQKLRILALAKRIKPPVWPKGKKRKVAQE